MTLALVGKSTADAPGHRNGPPAQTTPHTLTVSLISINYAPELTGIGVYTTGLAEHLAQAGVALTVHTAFPYYPQWAKRASDRRTLYRYERAGDVRLRRSYVFVPSRPTALRRILHELSFTISASVSYLFAPRADVTVIVSPPLALGIPLGLLARIKRSRLCFHVQDLQPDAAIDLGMLPRGAFSRALYFIERSSYRLAHRVSAISAGMARQIAAKGVPESKLVVLPNWADVEHVRPRPRDTAYREAWGLGDRFVAMYSGNLGVKQGLEVLLDAAAILDRTRPDIALVVVGDGGEKARLIGRAAALGLRNLQFRPLQPAERLSEMLATADAAIVTQRATVKDIVMPSKVGNIMSSARPIVGGAAPDSELAQVLHDADCALVVGPRDPHALADAVARLADAPEECKRLGANGRRYAEAFLNQHAILTAFLSVLAGLAEEEWPRERSAPAVEG